ncbi:MAG: hypothetical protein E7620_03895 [Ruminococcaceae bacterium]|nr:hypothetical protein [Oscillospiraceae bacterium]
MKKGFCLILALLMLAGCLSACGGKTNDPVETNPPATTAGGSIIRPGNKPGNVSTNYYEDYEKDDLPDTLDYGDYEFNILCDMGQYPKSFADTYTGDVINSALYTRKEVVQNRLGVVLNVDRQTGAYNGMADFTQKLSMAGADYDLVLAYNLTPATMAIQGLLYELNETQYLNFEKPWWSRTLLDNVTVGERVYFTADNSSWNNIRNMLGVFVDKELFLANHPDMTIDDLYDLVENKQWTMEKMFELVEGTYRDTATVGEITPDDVFGLSAGNNVWNEAWYFSAGFITLSKDQDGVWDFQIGTEKSLNFVDWFVSKLDSNDNVYRFDPTQYLMFKEKRVQFYLSALSMVEQQLEQPFAVLPTPMYNVEEQQSYITHFSNTYDMYGIPYMSKDPHRSSAVLECLASEAFRRIGPAYFEVYLKSRNVSDARLADMYDIIRAGIVFDMGVLFGELFVQGNNPIYYVRRALNGYIDSLGANWTEDVKNQYLDLWATNIDKLTNMHKSEA